MENFRTCPGMIQSIQCRIGTLFCRTEVVVMTLYFSVRLKFPLFQAVRSTRTNMMVFEVDF